MAVNCEARDSTAATLSSGEDDARVCVQLAAAVIVVPRSDAVAGWSADRPDRGEETAAHQLLQIRLVRAAAADQRLVVLGQLAGTSDQAGRVVPSSGETSRFSERDGDAPATISPSRHNLRGPAIREVAVHVLLAEPSQIEAIHYRRWYELVTDAGYAVVGKDPLAVFEPGVYEIDREPLKRPHGCSVPARRII